MGAQAAALLAACPPLGDVPLGDVPLGDLPPGAVPLADQPPGDVPLSEPASGRIVLATGPEYDLARTVLSHGGCGLAPTAWDGRLYLRLPDVTVVSTAPAAPTASQGGTGPATAGRPGALHVSWTGRRPDPAVLRHVLCLDDDVRALHEACDRVPELRWVRTAGAGRMLRSPSVFQELVGALAATNTSYRSTQLMLRALVGTGPFPTAEQVLEQPTPPGWGYRARHLRTLAERLVGGLDVQVWLDPDRPDEAVLAAVRALPGFGPFAAAQVLPLLGPRPRPDVPDSWLAGRAGDLSRFAPMGRWAGTGAWLAAAHWLRPSADPGRI